MSSPPGPSGYAMLRDAIVSGALQQLLKTDGRDGERHLILFHLSQPFSAGRRIAAQEADQDRSIDDDHGFRVRAAL